jgi:metal-responsive CopG/Arc/MetJ family transcriptional regulator
MVKTADIRVSLAEHLIANLDELAQRRGIQRSALLREAITEYLKRAESEGITQEMGDYVEALAPYSAEFVAETDAHTVERLLNETTW